MYIPIEVTAKNFQSFESLHYKFNVGKSNLIQGENLSDSGQESNGAGKSTLAEIVYYCCLGSSSTGKRDLKLIRRGETESNISFSLRNSIDNSVVRIERDLFLKKSSQLRVFINEQSQSGKFATINDGNEFVLNLLGISAEDIKNFYIINRERFKPFFKLSDTDSRELISRFSKLSFNEKLSSIIAKEVKDNQVILNELIEDKRNIELNIVEYNSKIDALKEQIQNIIDNNSPEKIQEAKKKSISLIEEQIEEIKLEKQSIINSNKFIDEKIETQKQLKLDCEIQRNLIARTIERFKKIDYSKDIEFFNIDIFAIEKKLVSKKTSKIKIEEDIQDLTKERNGIELLLSGKIVCPKCSNEFVPNNETPVSEIRELEKEVRETLTSLDLKLTEINNEIDLLKKEKSSLELKQSSFFNQNSKKSSLISKYEKQLQYLPLSIYDNKISELTQEVNSNKTKVSNYDNQIQTKKSEIENIKNSTNDNTLVLESLNKAIQSNQETLKECNEIMGEIDQSIEKQEKVIENKKSWELYFKQFYIYLTNQCLKDIQDLCNKFLEQIDTNLRVQIEGFKYLSDGSVKESINTVILRDNIEEDDYRSFSGGEKGKLILSTILAFQELINSNCPKGGLDLLFIDEILDAVDGKGMKSFIEALNSLTKTIYLTTHITIKDKEENIVLIRKINDKSYIA